MPNIVGRICDAGAGFYEDYIRIHVEAGIKRSIRADRHGPSGPGKRIRLRQNAGRNFSAGIVDGHIYIHLLSIEGNRGNALHEQCGYFQRYRSTALRHVLRAMHDCVSGSRTALNWDAIQRHIAQID